MIKTKNGIKILVCFLALLLVFTCTSCKSKEKTFSKLEMSIELTDDFHEKTHVGYTVYYESSDVLVVCLKEEFKLLAGSYDWTVVQYANACVSANSLKDVIVHEKHENEYAYFVFEKTVSGASYTYLATCHKAKEAFWLIQLATFSDKYEELSSTLFDYADSVTFE